MATHNQNSQPPIPACLINGHHAGNGHHHDATGTSDAAEWEREFQLLLDLLTHEPEIFLIY